MTVAIYEYLIADLLGPASALGTLLTVVVLASMLLANGIAEAMYNTAFGLGIAVTCMIGHVFLNAASKKQQHELEAFSMKLENLLAENYTIEPRMMARPPVMYSQP